MIAKAELRAAAKAARSSLSVEARRLASARAAEHVAKSALFRAAKRVALFAAMGDEADPSALARLAEGKILFFPRVAGSRLEMVQATPDLLTARGPFGIAEPPPSLPAADVETIDLFIVPGLCFTRAGDRIGYGKGYYDHLLARAKQARTIGFAFEVQLFPALPTESHDIRLDAIATEIALTFVDPSLL